MKTLLFILLVISGSAAMGQSLKDSLYGGKLKSPVGQTAVSKDTGKISVTRSEAISSQPGEKKAESAETKPSNETMPDSLNRLYYSKQKLFKRFIESNVAIITQEAESTRKVKKGEYLIEVDYEIGLNGRITTTGITSSPHNDFLLEKVRELMARPPVLSPPIYSDGKPRKAYLKQPITILKK
jgi:hypothetical protein